MCVPQSFTPGRKLRIGYYDDDGFFPVTPGVRRAVKESRKRLQELGHELIEFTPPRVEQVVSSFISILGADRGRYLLDAVYLFLIEILIALSSWPQISFFFFFSCPFSMRSSADDIDPVLKLTIVTI